MRLPPFEIERPATVEQAGALLDERGDDAALYCGGTELLLVAKLGFAEFQTLVDVKAIDELAGLSADGELRIGATVTHRELERSPLVRERWPSLAAMERNVGNIRVRNVGTIAGNLCFADPHSDPATYLIAAGGAVSARRGGGEARRIGIEELIIGPYETALQPGELLTAIHVPQLPAGSALAHRKISFHERPAATVAAQVTVAEGRISAARIGVGSVGVVPARAVAGEELLTGAPLDSLDGALAGAGDAAAEAAGAVEDSNGSVDYKRQLVRVLTARCVRAAAAEAVGGT